ncbi:hypothetical protein [Larkinella humicola]|uniref:Uncharacterized protein n=1 Tax=Larkinella humicola TaxID=2607654 RepID=A0A5N1JEX1_9BACT|nr:hypothetical protein [Larkinella humicola]KAA9353675.1 hypothetical protein F0P93_13655 [Larkinella humicola]
MENKLVLTESEYFEELNSSEMIEMSGGFIPFIGLLVGATALSYQLFKWGWDEGKAFAEKH